MENEIYLTLQPGETLQQALDRVPDGSLVHIPRGTYSMTPDNSGTFSCSLSNSDFQETLSAGLLLRSRKDLTLDFGGSTLLCHGQMSPMALLDCENISLRNAAFDWDIPLTAEGTIEASCDTCIDVRIDSARYPFHIEDKTLFFDCGEATEKLHFWGHTEFSPVTGKLAPDRGDRFPPTWQEQIGPDLIRFHGDFSGKLPTPKNILVLRHGDRIHPGLLIHHCRDMEVRELAMYGSGGLGILAQFSEDLRFSHVYIGPNRQAGRQFAGGHDDGIHLSADSGSILVEHCSFLGLMDDPLNLHGIAARVDTQTGPRTFLGRFLHPQSKGHCLWAEPGQTIAILDGDTMEELLTAAVSSFRLLDRERFEICFREELSLPQKNLSLENLSRTASLTCKHNYFGPCRARGILVTTPKKVVIEDNVFESAGAAIRIAGDVCTWYESGRCRDVTIRHNFFSDTCLQNDYQGGQGIISISPELPKPSEDHPCHQNISITENTFLASDSRILYALCTENLRFEGNQFLRSSHFKSNPPPYCLLEHCKNPHIEEIQF